MKKAVLILVMIFFSSNVFAQSARTWMKKQMIKHKTYLSEGIKSGKINEIEKIAIQKHGKELNKLYNKIVEDNRVVGKEKFAFSQLFNQHWSVTSHFMIEDVEDHRIAKRLFKSE